MLFIRGCGRASAGPGRSPREPGLRSRGSSIAHAGCSGARGPAQRTDSGEELAPGGAGRVMLQEGRAGWAAVVAAALGKGTRGQGGLAADTRGAPSPPHTAPAPHSPKMMRALPPPPPVLSILQGRGEGTSRQMSLNRSAQVTGGAGRAPRTSSEGLSPGPVLRTPCSYRQR